MGAANCEVTDYCRPCLCFSTCGSTDTMILLASTAGKWSCLTTSEKYAVVAKPDFRVCACVCARCIILTFSKHIFHTVLADTFSLSTS